MAEVLIALGSNRGDRCSALQRALDVLEDAISWSGVSPVYETAPMYVEDQPAFLNAVAIGSTEIGPLGLLDRLKAAERDIGRVENVRFGPRLIDIDLIAYGSLRLESRRECRTLELPHPRLSERRFVLAPLCDVAPHFVVPRLRRAADLLEATNEQADDVRMVNDAVLSVCRNRRSG